MQQRKISFFKNFRFFLFRYFNERSKYKLPHKTYEVLKNSYKARSYSEVN